MLSSIRHVLLLPFSFALLFAGCAKDEVHPDTIQPAHGTGAAVAMPDEHAADIAARILASGGNAVDAAVAAAFSLAVTYPEAGNIGGGGFMVLYIEGKPFFLDYRESAPAAADRDMYLDQRGDVIADLSFIGHLASGTPGTVAGLWAAHQRFGSLPWRDLLQPAITLANEGFIVDSQLAGRVLQSVEEYAASTNFEDYFGQATSGERFFQKELAATLQRIADLGHDGFYSGVTADLLVAEMQRGTGLITHRDLSTYKAVWREPLVADWRESQIIAAPPPSSGGFAVIQLLKMRDILDRQFAGVAHNSIDYIHLVAEMEKRVFADRAEYLGDPDYYDFDISHLLDQEYLRTRAAPINPVNISTMDEVRPGLEGKSTTHFSIIDDKGNAIANTYTINDWFGSRTVVEGAGFLLNNQMDDFSIKPNTPNFYGVVGSTANEIQPGKRMLSSMSPTILARDGDVKMVLGAEGGSTIITSVFQTIVNIMDFEMSAKAAVEQSFFHHQLLPADQISYSPTRPLPAALIAAGRERGYNIVPHDWEFGDIQLITRDGAGLHAVSDSRGRGKSIVLQQR